LNDYPLLAPRFWLKGAEPDATDIYGALDRGGVKDKLLLTKNVTRARVIQEMNALVDRSRAGDFVVIAYAGHGMQTPEYKAWKGLDPRGVNEQIALSNFDFKGDGAGEVIVNMEFRAWYARLDAKGVDTLVVMDSCFSGGMRSVDPRWGEMPVRKLEGSAGAAERDKFVALPMTEKEARTEITDLTRVTFLGGSTRDSVVPETTGLDPKSPETPRGALSYYVARAIEGGIARNGVVTRADLFKFVIQNARDATHGRQLVSIAPASEDPAIVGRTLLAFSAEGWTELKPVPAPEPAPHDDQLDAIRVAIIDGPIGAEATIQKGMAPMVIAKDVSGADILWDVGKEDALADGDVIDHSVKGATIGAIVDRTWALRRLRALFQSRVLPFGLASGGRALKFGEFATFETRDLATEYVTAFNIAVDGTIQMVLPPGNPSACANPTDGRWTCRLRVAPPFGADTIVAVATSIPPTPLIEWLKRHQGQRDAALLPDVLQTLSTLDPTARMGFAGIFTQSISD
jgi:hypothetical protein